MTKAPSENNIPEQVRVSLGSAIVLGLLKEKLNAPPTTAYLMTFRKDRCTANCGFCPQARNSHARADMLSRVSWPAYPANHVINRIESAYRNKQIKRVCIQALNYPEVFADLHALSTAISARTKIPISISCQPLNGRNIKGLAKSGVERIGIPLDAATENLFTNVKGENAGGPYNWKKQFELLRRAVSIFERGRVSTHLIVGLGETDREMVTMIQQCVDSGILPALFAFTPIAGTALEKKKQPSVQRYRRIQVAGYLIVHGIAKMEHMSFDEQGSLVSFGIRKSKLEEIIKTGEPFRTSGCPDCNRPYYNEKPSGPIFNFPTLPGDKELNKACEELNLPQP